MRLDDQSTLGNELRPRGPAALDASVTDDGGNATIVLRGELDLLTGRQLSSVLQPIIRQGEGDVTLDLSPLEFIDSSGLHVLLNTQRRLTRQGRRLRVVCVPGSVLRAIELVRLIDTLGVTVPA